MLVRFPHDDPAAVSLQRDIFYSVGCLLFTEAFGFLEDTLSRAMLVPSNGLASPLLATPRITARPGDDKDHALASSGDTPALA